MISSVRRRFRTDARFAARCYIALRHDPDSDMALVAAEHEYEGNELLSRWIKAQAKKR
jgi:hypothetical protein